MKERRKVGKEVGKKERGYLALQILVPDAYSEGVP